MANLFLLLKFYAKQNFVGCKNYITNLNNKLNLFENQNNEFDNFYLHKPLDALKLDLGNEHFIIKFSGTTSGCSSLYRVSACF